MITVRAYTRRPPARPTAFIEKCEQLLSDLRLERELRAREACEYALPVLERDLAEIVERDVLDDPQFNDLSRDDKARMREAF